MRRGSVHAVFTLAVSAAVLGLLAGSAAAESTFDKVKRAGKYVAGVRYDMPPLGTVDKTGNPVGFGVDLAKALADRLGVKVEFVQSTSKNRIPLLENGQIDMEIGVTTPTRQRDEVVDFTIVYCWDQVTLLVRKGESLNIKDYGPPRKVATTQGSLTLNTLKARIPNADVVLFQEYTDAVLALQNKKVDGVGMSVASATIFTKSNPRLAVGKPFKDDPWAIMVRQDDSKWRDALNFALQELWRDGVYQHAYTKHFGAEPHFQLWSPYKLQPGIGKDD